jgi:low affinity Fe/Cu permease
MTVQRPAAERESVFDRVADYVSAAMGRPLNIAIWLVLVTGWTVMFAAGLVNPAGTFLPAWFTSQGFNFPLNLVTTVAELFIGFLVAAASNRSERNLNRTLAAIGAQEAHIAHVDAKLAEQLDANTLLTRQIHELTTTIHDLVSRTHDMQAPQTTLLQGIGRVNAELATVREAVTTLPQDVAAAAAATLANQVRNAAAMKAPGTARGSRKTAPASPPPDGPMRPA